MDRPLTEARIQCRSKEDRRLKVNKLQLFTLQDDCKRKQTPFKYSYKELSAAVDLNDVVLQDLSSTIACMNR